MREEREVEKNIGRVGEKGKSWENERFLFLRRVRGEERAHFLEHSQAWCAHTFCKDNMRLRI
jgi:hypothetical protein